MRLKLYRLTDTKWLEPLLPLELPLVWSKNELIHWLDIEEANADDLRRLLAPLDLHPLVLEDCLDPTRSTLMDRYDRALYLEFPTHELGDRILRPYLSIVCLPDKLITIRQGNVPDLDLLATNLGGEIRLYANSKEALLYHILDYFIDKNILWIIDVRNQMDALTSAFYADPDFIEVEDILALRRRVGRLVAIAEDHLYCVTALQTVESRAFSIGQQREYYRDLVSSAEQAVRFTNRLEERLKELHEHYQLTLNDRFESRLRLLTILSAVFLPLTLISSIYGMNFENMPELQQPRGYFIVLGLMLVIALSMLGFFYRRGWFE